MKSDKYTVIQLDLRSGRDSVLGVASGVEILRQMEEAGDFAYEKDNGIVVLDPETNILAIPHTAKPYEGA